jgi:hypothetical protein
MAKARQRKFYQPSPVKPRRFFDAGLKDIYADSMLVNCPKCSGVGRIRYVEPSGEARDTWQFTCSRCSHRIVPSVGSTYGRVGNYPCDPYLGLALYLQVRTRHGVLFAYNEDHLDEIEGFVAAELRERRRNEFGWQMSPMVRLPPWVKSAKNREEILRALARLRRRLAVIA